MRLHSAQHQRCRQMSGSPKLGWTEQQGLLTDPGVGEIPTGTPQAWLVIGVQQR